MKKIIFLVLLMPLLAFSQTVQEKSANVKFTGGTIDGITIGGTTPAAISATTINGNTITTGSSTYTGTAGQTYTFPTTSATIARTDAANTFSGTQTFSSTINQTAGANSLTDSKFYNTVQMTDTLNGTTRGFISTGVSTTNLELGAGTVSGAHIGMTISSTGVNINNAITAPGLTTSSTAQTGTVCWTTGTGNFTVDTTTTCLLSARKYKQKIEPLNTGLAEVMQLRPVSYELKPKYNPSHLGRQVGFIADEVEKVDARFVSLDEKGKPHAVRYQQMVPLLVKAIQEQQTEIDELKRKLR